MSKDKLTKMKNSIYFNNSDDYLSTTSSSTSMLLGLESDVGIYFKDMRGSETSSAIRAAKKRTCGRSIAINSRVENWMFYIGQVQKMRVKVGSKWGILRQPIDLMKRTKSNGN